MAAISCANRSNPPAACRACSGVGQAGRLAAGGGAGAGAGAGAATGTGRASRAMIGAPLTKGVVEWAALGASAGQRTGMRGLRQTQSCAGSVEAVPCCLGLAGRTCGLAAIARSTLGRGCVFEHEPKRRNSLKVHTYGAEAHTRGEAGLVPTCWGGLDHRDGCWLEQGHCAQPLTCSKQLNLLTQGCTSWLSSAKHAQNDSEVMQVAGWVPSTHRSCNPSGLLGGPVPAWARLQTGAWEGTAHLMPLLQATLPGGL